MRPLLIVALALLLAGCASPASPHADRTSTSDDEAAPLPDRVELNRAKYVLGPSVAPVTDFQAVLGIDVPADRTRLTVEVTITLGAAVDLRMRGVAGCEHDFGAVYATGQTLTFPCVSPPGSQELRFTQSSPQAQFDVVVTATAA